MNFKRVGCILLYSEPVSFHFCIQCSLFLSTCTTWRCKSGLKGEWNLHEQLQYFVFHLSSFFSFFFCLIKDDATEKLWYLFQFLVFAFFFSLHIFVRRNSSLWDFILVWNFKNFSSAFRSSLSVFFLEKQFSYHVLEFRRKIEKDGGQTWSVFFRKTEINI